MSAALVTPPRGSTSGGYFRPGNYARNNPVYMASRSVPGLAPLPSSYQAYRDLKNKMKRWDRKYRMYGSKKRYSRSGSAVGYPPRMLAQSKFYTNHISLDYVPTRSLVTAGLLGIPKESTGTIGNLNTRSRDVVRVTGFKIYWHVMQDTLGANTTDYLLERTGVIWNMAVVAFKNTSANVIPAGDFFSGDGVNDRYLNFSTSLDANQMANAKINSDDYIVLWRQKVHNLFATETQEAFGEKWIPLNRQIRYEGDGDPHQNIVFVYWVTDTNAKATDASKPANDPPTIGTTSSARGGFRLETFFQNVEG